MGLTIIKSMYHTISRNVLGEVPYHSSRAWGRDPCGGHLLEDNIQEKGSKRSKTGSGGRQVSIWSQLETGFVLLSPEAWENRLSHRVGLCLRQGGQPFIPLIFYTTGWGMPQEGAGGYSPGRGAGLSVGWRHFSRGRELLSCCRPMLSVAGRCSTSPT